MTSRTHELAALTLLHIFILTQPLPEINFPTVIFVFGAVLVGGIFPDIDKPTSKIWERFPGGSIIGRLLQPFLGKHRHFSHSILGTLFYGLLIRILLSWLGTFILVDMQIVWVSFMIGFFSHILIDSLNKSGIPVLFPISIKFKIMGIKTGGFGEKFIISPLLLIFNLYLLYKHFSQYIDIFDKIKLN